jgi:hypothetical protein
MLHLNQLDYSKNKQFLKDNRHTVAKTAARVCVALLFVLMCEAAQMRI